MMVSSKKYRHRLSIRKMPSPKSKHPQLVCLICLKKWKNAEPKNKSNADGRNQSYQYQHRVLLPSICGGINNDDDPCEDRDEIGNNTKAGQKLPLEQNHIYTKLLQFSSRYLKLKTTTEPLLEGFKNGREDGNNFEAFCGDCKSLVGYVCDLYTELQIVRLHLVWKLSELGGKLTESKKLASHKLGGRRLVMSLAQQLNVKAVKQLNAFRKAFEIRCERKGKDCSPKPIVHRGLFPESLTHTFSATRKTLMHLIVVFVLASSYIYEKREEPEAAIVPIIDVDPPSLRKRPTRRGGAPLKKKSKIMIKRELSDEGAMANDEASDWSNGAASPMGESCGSYSDSHDGKGDDQDGSNVRNKIARKRKLNTKRKPVSGVGSRRRAYVKKLKGAKLKDPLKSRPSFVQNCTVCKKDFPARRHILEHLETAHETPEKTFQCWFCPKKFTVSQTRQLHRMSRHKGTKFRCASFACKEKIRTPEQYEEHLKKHAMETEPETSEGNVDHRLYAQTDQEKQPLTNTVSPEKDQERESLNENEIKSTEETVTPLPEPEPTKPVEKEGEEPPKRMIYRCSKCNWGFFNPDLVTIHELVHKETVDELIKCPQCDSFYFSIPILQKHYDRRHERFVDHPYECPECPLTTMSSKGLKQHMESHHNIINAGAVMCSECGFWAKDEVKLKRHAKRHNPNNVVRCSEEGCEATFASKSALATHVNRAHKSDNEKHHCPICGIAISDLRSVRKHLFAVHTPRYHVCDICGLKFRSRSILKDHLETHDPDRIPTNICSECGMSYNTRYGLKYHIMSVHTPESEKKFGCPYCPKRSHRLQLINMHIKTCMQLKGITGQPTPLIFSSPAIKLQYRGRIGRPPLFSGADETTNKRTTSEANTMEASNQEKAEVPTPSTSTPNSDNASVSDKTGIPEQQAEEEVVETEASTVGNVAVNSSQVFPAPSISLPTTVDYMLMQSILQRSTPIGIGSTSHQHYLRHNTPSSSVSSTYVPGGLHYSSYPPPQQNPSTSDSYLHHELHQHNRPTVSQIAPEDHYHPPNLSNMTTFPNNHVHYPSLPPPTEQPQNLHKSK